MRERREAATDGLEVELVSKTKPPKRGKRVRTSSHRINGSCRRRRRRMRRDSGPQLFPLSTRNTNDDFSCSTREKMLMEHSKKSAQKKLLSLDVFKEQGRESHAVLLLHVPSSLSSREDSLSSSPQSVVCSEAGNKCPVTRRGQTPESTIAV